MCYRGVRSILYHGSAVDTSGYDTMKKISRADAIKAGLDRYFTGEKCCRGHLSERRTNGCACVKCVRDDWHAKYGPQFREARKLRLRRVRAEARGEI